MPPMTAKRVMEKATSEDDLLTAITEALTWYGWKWTHSRRSDKAITMGHNGVPDIIAVRKGRVKFIELKSETGEITPAQWDWLHEAEPQCWHVSWHLWRPSDLDAALATLR